MKKIRYGLIVLWMMTCSVTFAEAQVSIGIGLPNVSIGINMPLYPELVPVPGYPVYYAPRIDSNYFFYDGMYWVYQDDNWYASSWYNGPWSLVAPEVVPLFVLRIPVRYYRLPPPYFRGWQRDAPPRWGQHWGHGWEQRRRGWDRWERGSAPPPAPLPVYQRQYSGDRYPRRVEQQQTLRSQHYRYQPRDRVVRQHFQQQGGQKAPAPTPAQRGRQEAPPVRSPQHQDIQRSTPLQQGGPAGQHSQPPHPGGENIQKSAPVHPPVQHRGPAVQDQRPQPAPPAQQRSPATHDQRQQPAAQQHEQQPPRSQEPAHGHGQEQKKDEERGGGHNN